MTFAQMLRAASPSALACCLLALPAHADSVVFQLTSPVLTASAGGTVTFSGTVLTTGNQSTVYFNSSESSVAAPLTIDDSSFFSTFPLSLTPNQSYTGALFSVLVPNGTTGAYNGSFALLGGANDQALDLLRSLPFEVDVPAVSATPEPSSLVLAGTGMVSALAAVVRRRRLSATA